MMESVITAYKAFIPTNPCRLIYHGNQGSKQIPLDKWIKADKKRVRDGSGDRWYESSFHVFCKLDEAIKWVKSLRREPKPVIIKVKVKGCRRKAGSKYAIFLANFLLVEKETWNNGICN